MTGSRRSAADRVAVLNTLGGTLEHYTEALRRTLERSGAEVEVSAVFEPSAGGGSAGRWLFRYLVELAKLASGVVRRRYSLVVVTWPVLGFLDLLPLAVLRLLGATPVVVFHDPEPLVRAVGYSSSARRLGKILAKDGEIVVHSAAAYDVLAAQGLGSLVTVLPHPLLPAAEPPAAAAPRTTVRVLGQYKPDRDLELLRAIGARSSDGAPALEIWGRGWPEVEGWAVHDGYVSESRLDELIGTSLAVLIPYRRFYQSGIALRAVESFRPFVGPQESSLADLYDVQSPLLVPIADIEDPEAWMRAVDEACALDAEELRAIASDASARSIAAWTQWRRTRTIDGREDPPIVTPSRKRPSTAA